MGFWQAVSTCLGAKYLTFSGRAGRAEYWLFWLFLMLSSLSFTIVEMATKAAGSTTATLLIDGVNMLFSLFMFMPNLAVGVRRLHDIDRTGWWLLLPVGMSVAGGVIGVALATSRSGGGAPMALAAIGLIVGAIVLFVFTLLPGTRGGNRFGPDPRIDDLSAQSRFA